MKKLLSLVLCLALLCASSTAMAAHWWDSLVDSAAEYLDLDKDELHGAVDEMADMVTSIVTVGFSKNAVAMNAAAQSVYLLKVVDGSGKTISYGSGFLCFNNHLVVTNYHVIEDAASIVLQSDDNQIYQTRYMIAADKEKDIAILYVENAMPNAVLKIKYQGLLRGTSVVAIGSGLGIKNTITKGSITNLVQSDHVIYVQHDAAINFGNSGGPLFDDNGYVIGINTLFVDAGDGLTQSVNWAVRMDQAEALYQKWDGVSLQRLPGASK